MNPSLTLALFERLSGAPLDAQGRARLDPTTHLPTNRHNSYGMRIPAPKQTTSNSAPATDNPAGIRNWGKGYQQDSYIQVPIFMEGIDDKKFVDIWPCVTFVESDLAPGTDPYVYNDPVGYTQGTASVVNPLTGYTITGPDQVVVREHPQPVNITYTVRMYSKDPIEIQWMERALLNLFKWKGAISIQQADGTYIGKDWSIARVAFFDQGEAFSPKTGNGPNQDRFLSRAFTIVFEDHMDNTVQGFGTLDWQAPQNTILARIMEIQGVYDRIYDGDAALETQIP